MSALPLLEQAVAMGEQIGFLETERYRAVLERVLQKLRSQGGRPCIFSLSLQAWKAVPKPKVA